MSALTGRAQVRGADLTEDLTEVHEADDGTAAGGVDDAADGDSDAMPGSGKAGSPAAGSPSAGSESSPRSKAKSPRSVARVRIRKPGHSQSTSCRITKHPG